MSSHLPTSNFSHVSCTQDMGRKLYDSSTGTHPGQLAISSGNAFQAASQQLDNAYKEHYIQAFRAASAIHDFQSLTEALPSSKLPLKVRRAGLSYLKEQCVSLCDAAKKTRTALSEANNNLELATHHLFRDCDPEYSDMVRTFTQASGLPDAPLRDTPEPDDQLNSVHYLPTGHGCALDKILEKTADREKLLRSIGRYSDKITDPAESTMPDLKNHVCKISADVDSVMEAARLHDARLPDLARCVMALNFYPEAEPIVPTLVALPGGRDSVEEELLSGAGSEHDVAHPEWKGSPKWSWAPADFPPTPRGDYE